MRHRWRVLLLLPLMWFALPTLAHADTTPARLRLAAAMVHTTDSTVARGPSPDYDVVARQLTAVGVDLAGITGVDSLAAMACTTPVEVSAPRPAGPAPGDLAFYTSPRSDADPSFHGRVGVFTGADTVVVWDPGTGGFISLLRPELSGDFGGSLALRRWALPDSFHACRIGPGRWPGGRDDVSITAGKIALVDPNAMLNQLQWSAEHPRDADTHWYHGPGSVLGGLLAVAFSLLASASSLLSTAVQAGVGGLGRAIGAMPLGDRLLSLLEPVGRLLGASFDGTRFHVVLTDIGMGLLGGLGGWALLLVVSRLGIPGVSPAAGRALGALRDLVSFAVSVTTGVENGRTSPVGIVVALLSDLVLVLKPARALSLAGRAGGVVGRAAEAQLPPLVWSRLAVTGRAFRDPMEAFAGRLGPVLDAAGRGGSSALGIISTARDAVQLRPHGVTDALRAARLATNGSAGSTGGEALGLVAPAIEPLTGARVGRALLRCGFDMSSLFWRPTALIGDLSHHAAEAALAIDQRLTGAPGLNGLPISLRAMLQTLPPDRLSAVVDAARGVQIWEQLVVNHSGAAGASMLASGTPLPPAKVPQLSPPATSPLPTPPLTSP